jgi:exopolysaccharide production protein ExoY
MLSEGWGEWEMAMDSTEIQVADRETRCRSVVGVTGPVAIATTTTADLFRFPTESFAQEQSLDVTNPLPWWKRALDIACVLVALPLLLPLMLVIALLIKTRSPGPILFKQERVGYRGQRFMLFKFRSMILGASTVAHQQHVSSLMDSDRPMVKLDARGDPRLIPYGRLLRAAGLDELPQLINVLRGEMSLVGPRPCVPYEYEKFLPWQKERFDAVPGLTGLWQVSGKNRTTFEEMIRLDIRYARSRALWLDAKIMLKTLPAVAGQIRDTVLPSRRGGSRVLDHARVDVSVGTT